jgi:hypothetical protein
VPQILTVGFTVKLDLIHFSGMGRSLGEIPGQANGLNCIFQAVDHVSLIVDGDT